MTLCALVFSFTSAKAIDKDSNYSESGIINRKTGELVHEITKNIKSENSEKDITFYSCKKREKV